MRNVNASHDQKRLREIAWQIGQRYSTVELCDCCVLLMASPHRAHVFWSVNTPAGREKDLFGSYPPGSARTVIRLHDVTDIIYNGSNAHRTIEVFVEGFRGSRDIPIDQSARNYLAEFGLLYPDGKFRCLARSGALFFDRDRPSGAFRSEGVFVDPASGRMIPVENIYDAPVFERMHRETSYGVLREQPHIAVIRVAVGTDPENPFTKSLDKVLERVRKFGFHPRLFIRHIKRIDDLSDEQLADSLGRIGKEIGLHLAKHHAQNPFHLMHCHDWTAATAAMPVAEELGLPMVLTLHSTEYERSAGMQYELSEFICQQEVRATAAASLVIVPHSSLRQQVITLYGVPDNRIMIIPDVIPEAPPADGHRPEDMRRALGFPPDSVIALFAGEMSHAAGADILVDALHYVCSTNQKVQFVFAGEGPLREELQRRVAEGGALIRCRFLGDVQPHDFEHLLAASDFVVIPARTWQDAGLAQRAIAAGKPVLTTHQAGIGCVVHGENGLVTYDNPNSIIWGIQELLHRPLHESMARSAARAGRYRPSLDAIAAQHCICYGMIVRKAQGEGRA